MQVHDVVHPMKSSCRYCRPQNRDSMGARDCPQRRHFWPGSNAVPNGQRQRPSIGWHANTRFRHSMHTPCRSGTPPLRRCIGASQPAAAPTLGPAATAHPTLAPGVVVSCRSACTRCMQSMHKTCRPCLHRRPTVTRSAGPRPGNDAAAPSNGTGGLNYLAST